MWTFLSPRDHRKNTIDTINHIKPNYHCHTEIPELVDSNGAEPAEPWASWGEHAWPAAPPAGDHGWNLIFLEGNWLVRWLYHWKWFLIFSNKLSWFFAKTQHSLYTNVSFQNISSEKWLVLYVLCFMAKTNHPSGNHRGLDIQRDSPRGTNPNVAKGVLGLSSSIIKPYQGQRIW
jgi:hypothetical protein